MLSRNKKWMSAMFMTLPCLLMVGNCYGEVSKPDSTVKIVASMLKAYGGAEAVRKVVSVTAKGRIVEPLNGNEGSYARFLERHGKLLIEIMPERGGEIRVLNGDRGWQGGRDGFILASPLQLQSMRYQYSYLDLPMKLSDKDLTISCGGTQLHNGRKVFLLMIDLKNVPRLNILVDAKTFLIVRVAASFAMGMGSSTSELSTEYSDYRVVGGVLFPFRLINSAGAMKLSEIVLDEIAVNRKISANLFTPL